MNIQRGMRDKLDSHVNAGREIAAEMSVVGSAVYDYCCFGVDAAGKLSDDRYMVFYNQSASPGGEIRYTPSARGATFQIRLADLPASIDKLVFTVSIDGEDVMGNIRSHTFEIKQDGQSALRMDLSGSDFMNERAIISMELYRKNGIWRFAAVARGFNGGLGDLLRSYGGEEASGDARPQPQPAPRPQPQSGPIKMTPPTPQPVPESQPKRVELRKGQKVSLVKKRGGNLGEVLINLNWSQPANRGGLFAFRPAAIDLDLGCLYELKDGTKGCVQALGKSFGNFDRLPYIALDGDDRTGAVANGENLRVNGSKISLIKRILVYTFIYDGAANWKEADGVVTVKCSGSPDIIVRMDEYGSNLGMCAIALLENDNDETFSIEKLIRFFRGHSQMDEAFHWGLRWVRGTKD